MAKKSKASENERKRGKRADDEPKKKNKKKAESAEKSGSKKKKKGDEEKAAKKAKPPRKPKPVKTGKGASPAELGARFVALFNEGKIDEIESQLWSDKIVSVEGVGVEMAWHGRAAVDEKNRGWLETHKIHSARAEGPFVGATGFSVKFSMDVEETANGNRLAMEEIGVYAVERGKIVREEFMYGG